MIIYRALNQVTGKCYIGQTRRSFSRRITEHKRDAAYARNVNSPFYRSINKHGADAFVWEILEECIDPFDLDMAERFWIKTCNAMAPSGYNLHAGGFDSKEVSAITRKRIGDAQRGKPKSIEHRRKISETNKRKVKPPVSGETRTKMSITRKGKPRPDGVIAKTTSSRRAKSKLNWGLVHNMRADFDGGLSRAEIVTKYGVDRCQVYKIVMRLSWVI